MQCQRLFFQVRSICLRSQCLIHDNGVITFGYKFDFLCHNCTREFDENLLRSISEVFYEDEAVNLPAAPDVSNYLMSEVFELKICNLLIC